MDPEIGILNCTVAVDQLGTSGEVQKKTVYKNAVLTLGRNEFKDIVLKLNLNKRMLSHRVQDLTVHKRFAKEGKATLKLENQKLQFMLSNCPPDKLIMFLKTLSTKLECLKMKGAVSERQRLLSAKQRTFQEISPLNMKELQSVHNKRAKEAEGNLNIFTPKGKHMKRKRPADACNGKENTQPNEGKIQKRQKVLQMAVTKFGGVGLQTQKILNPVVLSKEQQKVLEAVRQGSNIFFTGSAGTGKSFLLKRIIGALPPHHTFATASTGVAACHIGGTTLHAFAGIGSGSGSVERCLELASRTQVAQNWKKCKHLIIDEISMVDGDMFDKLDLVAKVTRQNTEPFGGIQLILCGDFLQLPPVTKGSQKRKFAFQSKAWRRAVTTNMELKEVRRQSDLKFIRILQNIRLGRCPSDVSEGLSATSKHQIERNGIQATRLCTHKEDVDHINEYQMKRLKGESSVFHASDSEDSMVRAIDQMCPVKKTLDLKLGAQVMLCKNLDVSKGLVNGARGVISGFENDPRGYPIIKFLGGEETSVKPEKWVFKMTGGVFLTRRQLPLKLAWAISIHKSQGMSLDCVEMSLSKVFESGQAYVALSRAKSLEGLRVLDFDRDCVRADQQVLNFYRGLQMVEDTSTGSMSHTRDTPLSQDHW